jgi:hypothetical protein
MRQNILFNFNYFSIDNFFGSFFIIKIKFKNFLIICKYFYFQLIMSNFIKTFDVFIIFFINLIIVILKLLQNNIIY